MPLEEAPSEIQRRMYEFIVNYMKSQGMPPTNREIGRELHITSTGHVDYHLTMLEKKGLIIRQPKEKRGIKLIKQFEGIPIIGTIAAGEPLDIFSDARETPDTNHRLIDTDNTYALVVKGNSMIKDHICDGDYVIIKPQSTCQNGDIVVALHTRGSEHGSVTLKRFFKEKDHDRVRLQPANPELEPILISQSEWDHEWQVQGKVVAIFRQSITEVKLTDSMVSEEESPTNTSINSTNEQLQEASDRLRNLIDKKTTTFSGSAPISSKDEEKSADVELSSKVEVEAPGSDQDKEIVKETQRVIDLVSQQTAAYERITTAAKSTREQLDQIYGQGQSQANRWFQLGLGAAIIGFLVIIIGAILAMFTASITGILTSIASVIPGTVSVLFFQQAKEANKRLDDFYGKLIEIEEINRAVELSLTASNEAQDHYKGLIIFRLLGLHREGQEIPILDLLNKVQETHSVTLIKETNRKIK